MGLTTRVILIALMACRLGSQSDQPIGPSFQQTAELLQQRAAMWPSIGFIDFKKPAEANSREGALLARLLRQMESDYSKSPAGLLSPTQEAYYCQVSAVLYQKGGYSNWHLAQVLDFRVAYSIAKRLHQTGKATEQDQALVQGMSKRIFSGDLARELIRQEASPQEADKMASMAERDEINVASRIIRDRFGALKSFVASSKILAQKQLPELVWRLMLHSMIVKQVVPAFIDYVGKSGKKLEPLKLEDQVDSVLKLVNVAQYRYEALDRDRLEDRDVKALIDLLTDSESVFHTLGVQ